MKSFLRGTTALAGIVLAGSAFAADLPRRAAPPVFVPVPVFTWTGFYAGFNAGYAFDAGNAQRVGFVETLNNPVSPIGPGGGLVAVQGLTPIAGGGLLTFNQQDRGGFSGGGQVGYNYQFTPGSGLVVGIEADAQYLDLGGRRNNNFVLSGNATGLAPGFTPVNGQLSGLDFFGTVRGRVGYAVDRVLFYGTGGFAYGMGSANRFAGNNGDDFRTGYAAGGGVEYALPTDSFLNFFRSSAVTLKVEGLYVNLERNNRGLTQVGTLNLAGAGGVVPVFDNGTFAGGRRSDEFAVVRAGLNYKFGSY